MHIAKALTPIGIYWARSCDTKLDLPCQVSCSKHCRLLGCDAVLSSSDVPEMPSFLLHYYRRKTVNFIDPEDDSNKSIRNAGIVYKRTRRHIQKLASFVNSSNLISHSQLYFNYVSKYFCRSQWPRGLRRRFAAARLAEIVGSNPTGVMDVCLLWVSFVVRNRSLRLADHSSRGVLPNVVRRCVWSRNLMK